MSALHRALLGRSRSLAPSLQAARQALLERALAEGPASLTGRERRILLGDPDLTDALHRRVWALPDHERAQVLDEVGALVEGFPERFPLPYVTELLWCTRR